MIVRRDIVQGTPEWIQARLGLPSASRFHRIISPVYHKTAGQQAYLCELVAERLFREPTESASSPWMDRGKEMEAAARDWYSLWYAEAETVGGVTTDDGRVWCSPDGLVGDDGGLEVKTPGAAAFVEACLFVWHEQKKDQADGQ